MAQVTDAFVLPQPDDHTSVWIWDEMHTPRPLAPLAAELWESWNLRALGRVVRTINGYPYLDALRPLPLPDLPPSSADPRSFWFEEMLPQLQSTCEGIRNRPYDQLSLGELVTLLPVLFEESTRAFACTMDSERAIGAPSTVFFDFCHAKLGERGETLAATALQGFENESLGTAAALHAAADVARRHPSVVAALRAGTYEELSALPGGPETLHALQRYLDEYRDSTRSWCEIDHPTVGEDRAGALGLVARLCGEDPTAAAARHDEVVSGREAALAELEQLLPEEDDRARFHELLAAARAYVPVIESRARWQMVCCGVLRQPLLLLGRRFVEAGVFDDPSDVFYFRTHELLRLAAEGDSEAGEAVRARRSDLAVWTKLDPPVFLGVPVPPEVFAAIPFVRRLFGFGAARMAETGMVQGIGASRGVVRGIARVIDDPDDAERLGHGDVLVCRMTAPPWTPLFSIAGAIVTDAGGILSHAAIEAREYGIPAVVGTRDGTHRIPDGAWVTVDGAAGTVRLG